MTEDTVTLSRAAYDALVAEIEDLRDSLELEKARAEDDGTRVPGEVVFAQSIDGDHPVAAWRKHRGLSVEALARITDVAPDTIRDIEARRTSGAAATYRALSTALAAPIDLLIPEDG